jgi:hypothetical protein
MKASILCLNLIFILISCSKSSSTPTVYTDAKGTSISFSADSWTTSKSATTSKGSVDLKIAGSTNAERLTIRTYGATEDGLVNDILVKLDSKKNFNESVQITYTNGAAPTTQFELTTEAKAFSADDTLVVTLKSGKLKY